MGIPDIARRLEQEAIQKGTDARRAFMAQGPQTNMPMQEEVAKKQATLQQIMALAQLAPPGSPARAALEQQAAGIQASIDADRQYFEFDPNAGAQFREGQAALVNALQARASGQAPSAAELAAQAQSDRNMRAASSLAASAQGVSPGLALRQAQQSQGQMGVQTLQELARIRAEEQARAEAALVGLLGGARGQDIGLQQGVTGSRLDMAGIQAQREAAFMGAAQADRARKQARGDMLFGTALKAGGTAFGTAMGGPTGGVAGAGVAEEFDL